MNLDVWEYINVFIGIVYLYYAIYLHKKTDGVVLTGSAKFLYYFKSRVEVGDVNIVENCSSGFVSVIIPTKGLKTAKEAGVKFVEWNEFLVSQMAVPHIIACDVTAKLNKSCLVDYSHCKFSLEDAFICD